MTFEIVCVFCVEFVIVIVCLKKEIKNKEMKLSVVNCYPKNIVVYCVISLGRRFA